MRDTLLLMTGIVLFILSPISSFAQGASQDVPPLSQNVDVLIELNLVSGFFNGVRPDSVGILGSQPPLGNDVGEVLLLEDPENDHIWNGAFTITQGKDADLAYRFIYQVEGKWVEESLPGNANHLVLVDDTERSQRIAMVYTPQNGIIPGLNEKGFVDEYSTVIDLLGERGNSSPYTYYDAVTKLNSGDLPAAEIAYQKYLEHRPDAITSDEYPFLYARYLENQGDHEDAISYLEGQEKTAPGLERKAQFALRAADTIARNGDLAVARDEYDRIIGFYRNQTEAINEARYSRALTHFKEDNTSEGIEELEEWVLGFGDSFDPTDPPGELAENDLRKGYSQIARGYLRVGDLGKADVYFSQLSAVGTPVEQLKGVMQGLDVKLRQDEPLAVLNATTPFLDTSQVDSLIAGEIPSTSSQLALIKASQRSHIHEGLLLLQARAYEGLERKEEMIGSLERLVKEHPEGRYASYARKLLGQ